MVRRTSKFFEDFMDTKLILDLLCYLCAFFYLYEQKGNRLEAIHISHK